MRETRVRFPVCAFFLLSFCLLISNLFMLRDVQHWWRLGGLGGLAMGVTYGLNYCSRVRKTGSYLENALILVMADVWKCLVFYGMMRWSGEKRMTYSRDYLIFGWFSFFQSFGWLVVVRYLSVFYLQIVSNFRSFFVFGLSILVFNRVYTRVQWLAQVVLVFGITLPFIVQIVSKDEAGMGPSSYLNAWLSIGLSLLMTLSTALNGVCFEKIVRKKRLSMWQNSLNYSLSGLLVSVLALVCIFGWFGSDGLVIDPGLFLSLVCLKVVEGIIYAYIMAEYSAVAKTFFQVLMNCLLSVILSWHLAEKMSIYKIVSLVLVAGSICVFNLRSNK
ncbi:hypothetical protein NEHOM01_0285 [Nematocida homosporus]|uniref:uncharacterized protein n=1 Tax=Nematocida homosporus TaxID=1912981 RepID=UPI00221F836E|nr:uncharacterized protein NEHOM01_0285 [Nematocida homosporus]KAI5184610.1 hypothetical protein NEHOM01_0285 [Nematocida homosporus]